MHCELLARVRTANVRVDAREEAKLEFLLRPTTDERMFITKIRPTEPIKLVPQLSYYIAYLGTGEHAMFLKLIKHHACSKPGRWRSLG